MFKGCGEAVGGSCMVNSGMKSQFISTYMYIQWDSHNGEVGGFVALNTDTVLGRGN